ncbi:MAG: helix-turn-helix domain-containing protein [Clostridia bacterium]|nr:helix-turn-helix domain-containing protein [Clostridia bacterium]
MKLNLGENIRTCRRKMDMTQEQLAERLGVSFQSVSRWENGTTYPDMELLPVLAGIFGVTTDMLLGVPDEKVEERFTELVSDFRAAAEVKDYTRTASVLQEMRRDWDAYAGQDFFYVYNHAWVYKAFLDPGTLDALRCLTEQILQNSNNKERKNYAIREMGCMEDDAHIAAFLQENATEYDLSEHALLRERYRMRGQWDKLEDERKRHLCLTLDNVLWSGPDLWQTDKMNKDPSYALWQSSITLQFLHQINSEAFDPLRPIRGKNGIDIWVEARLSMGFRRAACLAVLGEAEEAYITLEDTVSLLEAVMALPDTIKELTCTSPALEDFTIPAEFYWMEGDTFTGAEKGVEEKHFQYHLADGTCWWVIPRNYYCCMTDRRSWGYTDWTWFDPIRTDPRYQSYVDRVRACIITRPKQDS